MWDKAKDFVVKAFTIIFMATIIVWVLQNFGAGFRPVTDSADSLLAMLGQLLAPVFAPLGFGDWRAATALVTGLMAKETVVSTLAVLMNVGDPAMLAPVLSQLLPLWRRCPSWCLRCCICPVWLPWQLSGGSWAACRGAVTAMAFQTGVAWVVAFLVYHAGVLLGF